MGDAAIALASSRRRADDWACVLLSVDLRAAIAAGVPFCRAANGVVLSEGPIPLKFVQRVKVRADCKGRQLRRLVAVAAGCPPHARSAAPPSRTAQLHELPEDWQREMPNPERLFREELP